MRGRPRFFGASSIGAGAARDLLAGLENTFDSEKRRVILATQDRVARSGGGIVLKPGTDTAEAVWAKRGFFKTSGKWMVKPVSALRAGEGPALVEVRVARLGV